LLALGLAVVSPPRVVAQQGTPLDAVRSSNQEVVAAFEDGDVLTGEGEERVREIMNRYTDFAALSGAAIDEPCAAFDPEECAALKATFSELLRVSSIRKLGRYRADAFDYQSEEVDAETAVVRTVAHYGDRALPLDYELRRGAAGDWMVVNYTLNHVDTVRVYRKQFVRLLGVETVVEVVARLDRKIDELRRGAQVSPGPVRRRE
jgi:ABC-type transporter MlaC component